jgi:two-component system nitrogen regulation sensor histidine kinase GlnL
MADADRLGQVFHNLVRNALEAMCEDGGTLTIRTRIVFDHRLGTEADGSVPTLLVEICDSGPGIDPELLPRVATPFFTTKDRGSGLGLAVSQHWAMRHGGVLRIDSSPGEGTRVGVALPLRTST